MLRVVWGSTRLVQEQLSLAALVKQTEKSGRRREERAAVLVGSLQARRCADRGRLRRGKTSGSAGFASSRRGVGKEEKATRELWLEQVEKRAVSVRVDVRVFLLYLCFALFVFLW